MTWHLKDRELEKKLIAIDPGFGEKLNQNCEIWDSNHDGDLFELKHFEQILRYKNKLLGNLLFTGDQLENIPDYNAGGWNHWPETKPEECVLMEIKIDGDEDHHGFNFFLNDIWYHSMGCSCIALSDEEFSYRPAKLFFEEQRINKKD